MAGKIKKFRYEAKRYGILYQLIYNELREWLYACVPNDDKDNIEYPGTFNEKIQCPKLYDNIPIKTHLSDKLLVRDWVKEKLARNTSFS